MINAIFNKLNKKMSLWKCPNKLCLNFKKRMLVVSHTNGYMTTNKCMYCKCVVTTLLHPLTGECFVTWSKK